MKFSNFRYLVKDGAKNIWFNRLMSFASVGTLTACLILVGFAVLFSLNISSAVTYVEQQNELVVFLKDDITEDQKNAVEGAINSLSSMKSYEYISKEDALEDQKEKYGDAVSILSELDKNPYPASYRIKLEELEGMGTVVSEMQGMAGVENVRAPTEVANVMINMKNIVSVIGVAIILILFVVSLVIIANTIRITVFSRRKEINIMKYVGAKDSFIWLPFIVEGMILGGISALLSYGVLWYAYDSITKWLATSSSSWIAGVSDAIIPFGNIWWCVLIGFVLFGIGMGVFGSLISTRKYLKV